MVRGSIKYIFLFVFIVFLIACLPSLAKAEENDVINSDSLLPSDFETRDVGYVIENYDINIKVGEDNVLQVIETIDVNFNQYAGGITRKISLLNKIKNFDGSITKRRGKLSNLQVNDQYSRSPIFSNLQVFLEIGTGDREITGNKRYIIKYDYSIGKDRIKQYDELYFDLTDTEWKSGVEKVTFKIEMPKEFDSSLLAFGGYSSNDLKYVVEDNTISGYTTKPLLAGQGLNVRLELPENYFSQAEYLWTNLIISMIAFPLIAFLAVVAIVIYCKVRDKQIYAVEFYPPKGLNCLDVRLIYKSKIENTDLPAFLIYLASKGYIKVEESSSKDAKFIVKKLKNYDGNNIQEREFMEIFEKNETLRLTGKYKEAIARKSLNILASYNYNVRADYFSKKDNLLKSLASVLGLIALISPGIIIMGRYMLILYFFTAFSIFFTMYLAIKDKKEKFLDIFSLFFGGIPAFIILSLVGLFGMGYVIITFLGMVYAVIINMFLIDKIACRNKKGKELYAKILGFRKFIEMVEKDELEALALENPTYYYDIIPYAYVLGVSDVWIEKFKNIAICQPEHNGVVFK